MIFYDISRKYNFLNFKQSKINFWICFMDVHAKIAWTSRVDILAYGPGVRFLSSELMKPKRLAPSKWKSTFGLLPCHFESILFIHSRSSKRPHWPYVCRWALTELTTVGIRLSVTTITMQLKNFSISIPAPYWVAPSQPTAAAVYICYMYIRHTAI